MSLDSDVLAVERFRVEHDLPGIVDVHTHFMPKNVMDKVWSYFDSVGPLTGIAWPIAYRLEEDRRLDLLRRFEVRTFTSMVYPHKPQMAAWLNSWAADFASRTPQCLHTATFYPEPGAGRYVEAALDAGARIFKSHIQVGQYDPGNPLLDAVWGAIADSETPVVIHCGSGPTPGPYTGPDPIAAVLQRFPRLPLIIAHMGMPEYHDFMVLADRYPNVRLDTTMTFTEFSEASWPFPPEDRHRLRDLQHKVLFGSDFPNIPYSYAESLDALARLDLGSDWVRDVCWNNGSALFGR